MITASIVIGAVDWEKISFPWTSKKVQESDK
jgi:hypothetical protein